MTTIPKETHAYELRIELDGIKPPIWRSVAVPSGITLDRLHDVIQIAMGWLDCHAHLFDFRGRRFSEDPAEGGVDDQDEAQIRLCDVIQEEGERFVYTYDFGDDWRHSVTLTRIVAIPDGHIMRLQCGDGQRARPPEDVGGLPGFQRFREAMKDKNHPEHERLKEWHGGRFQPNRFRIDEVNDELAKYTRWSRNRSLPWPSKVE